MESNVKNHLGCPKMGFPDIIPNTLQSLNKGILNNNGPVVLEITHLKNNPIP